jgi:hypothetical protein
MTRLPRFVFALLAGAALSACAGGTPVISYSYVVEHYDPEMLGYPASRGGLYTEVVGNPFKADKAALDTRVTEAFEAAHFGPPLDFVTEKPAADAAYHVVVLFNPARHANAARLCSSADRPQASRAPGEVGVMAAFCSSGSRISSTVGRVGGAQGPDDPAFGRLLAQVGLSLFPPAPGVRRDEPEILVP